MYDTFLDVSRPHLAAAEEKAVKDQEEAENRFLKWASQKVPGAELMNVGSGAQIRQLLFAGVQNQKPEKGSLETERVFKVSLPLLIASALASASLPWLSVRPLRLSNTTSSYDAWWSRASRQKTWATLCLEQMLLSAHGTLLSHTVLVGSQHMVL